MDYLLSLPKFHHKEFLEKMLKINHEKTFKYISSLAEENDFGAMKWLCDHHLEQYEKSDGSEDYEKGYAWATKLYKYHNYNKSLNKYFGTDIKTVGKLVDFYYQDCKSKAKKVDNAQDILKFNLKGIKKEMLTEVLVNCLDNKT